MDKQWEKIDKIGLDVMLNVSSRGDGLVLFLPKNIWQTYEIISSDRITVKLQDLYRRKHEEEAVQPSKSNF